MTLSRVGPADRGARRLVASSPCMRVVIAWLCVGGAVACSSTGGSSGAKDDAGADATSMDGASADVEGSDGGPADAAHPPRPDGGIDASADATLASGPPSLVSLSVSAPGGDGSTAVMLVPAFSADIHDYAVLRRRPERPDRLDDRVRRFIEPRRAAGPLAFAPATDGPGERDGERGHRRGVDGRRRDSRVLDPDAFRRTSRSFSGLPTPTRAP